MIFLVTWRVTTLLRWRFSARKFIRDWRTLRSGRAETSLLPRQRIRLRLSTFVLPLTEPRWSHSSFLCLAVMIRRPLLVPVPRRVSFFISRLLTRLRSLTRSRTGLKFRDGVVTSHPTWFRRFRLFDPRSLNTTRAR